MKISKMAIFLGLVPAMLFTSCATIIHGSKQSINISSTPAMANIWIDGMQYGQTPAVVKLARQDTHIVQIELEGYHTYQMHLTKEVSGWVFGNIAFGGIFGLAIDAITGSIYRLTPEQIHANMCQHNMSATTKGNDSYVAVVLEVDPSWQKIGQLETN